MRVKIYRDPVSDFYSIWFLQDDLQNKTFQVVYPSPGFHTEVRQLDRGDLLPEPSLRLSEDMLRSFVEEASKVTPPNEAVERHLKDAIVIRDRLLTIVEKNS